MGGAAPQGSDEDLQGFESDPPTEEVDDTQEPYPNEGDPQDDEAQP